MTSEAQARAIVATRTPIRLVMTAPKIIVRESANTLSTSPRRTSYGRSAGAVAGERRVIQGARGIV